LIAVVYTFASSSKKSVTKKNKKYIHEIKVDLPGCREKGSSAPKD